MNNTENIICNCQQFSIKYPPQHQNIHPGLEYLMNPLPIFDNPNYIPTGKLKNKVAIITGGDSGIGKAVAVAYAKEGALLTIVYLNEDIDAVYTKQYIESLGGKVLLLKGDIREHNFCKEIVIKTIKTYGYLDILVNNAAVIYPKESILNITDQDFDKTMKTNIYSIFYLAKESLPYLKEGSSIINVSSQTAFTGNDKLIDYSASKGAIISFTRSLADNLISQKIRVNAVAPGIFWTPIQPSSWPAEKIPTLGIDSPMKRVGEPYEIAPIFVYLASQDSTYTTGQTFHINGGQYKN